MATEKVSLTLDEEFLAEARKRVGARGCIAGLLAELEQEHGPVEPEIMEEVRRAWPLPEERHAKRRSA